jgi:hypothetical protein
MNCVNSQDGDGCAVCFDFAKVISHLEFDLVIKECLCNICQCQCTVLCSHHKWWKLAD